MPQAPPTPLFAYAGMLWRRKILIAMVTVALTTPALVISLLQTPEYQASSALALSSPTVSSDQSVTSGNLSETDMSTQAAVMKGDAVQAAAVALGAQSPIFTSVTSKSNILTITASGVTPEAAARTTNAYADAYTQLRVGQQREGFEQAAQQIQGRIDTLRGQLNALPNGGGTESIGQLASLESQQSRIELGRSLAANSVQVVVRAVPPTTPSSPQVLRNTLVGLVLGLALGIAIALLTEAARRRPGSSAPSETHNTSEDRVGASRPADSPTVRTESVPRQVRTNHIAQPPPQSVQVGSSGPTPSPRPR